MKLGIVGSRTVSMTPENILKLFNDNFESKDTLTIVSGGARGADTSAKLFAQHYKLRFVELKADWNRYGKSAGYKRNVVLVDYCDEILALWDGVSKGTMHTCDIAKKLGKKCIIININEYRR